MALTLCKKILQVGTLTALYIFVCGQSEPKIPPELPDPKAVQAFNEYWNSFEEYEQNLIKTKKKTFLESWEKIKEDYNKDQVAFDQEQRATLQRSLENYRKHLKEHNNAENRPYVMLNLAQIQIKLADLLEKDEANDSHYLRQEALSLLKEVQTEYPTFAYKDAAQYLRAVTLSKMAQDKEALTIWENLSVQNTNSIFSLRSQIAVGDHYFYDDNPKAALKYYQSALNTLSKADIDDRDYETLRIQYRLAWAAYRAAELETAIAAATAILLPGRDQKLREKKQKIERDVVEIIGDALYENNDLVQTRSILQNKELLNFAPAIGLRVVERFGANNLHDNVIEVGQLLVNDFPLSKEIPLWLIFIADAYAKQGKASDRIAILERLALILPQDSLWRARHKEDFDAIQKMEEQATNAARLAAAYHYDHGMSSGNVNSFLAAASFFEILLTNEANGDASNEWRLKHAHCYYFAGKLEKAATLYTALKTNFKITPEMLQISAYQLVLTYERMWREAFALASAKDQNPNNDPIVIEQLRNLEKSIEEFADRFPEETRTSDVLIVAGSVNRDLERYDESLKYWQRVLLSQANSSQRAIAIRGVVMAKARLNQTADVVEVTKKFIRLEDWNTLGKSLRSELHGVLTAAVTDESNRLSKEGKVQQGGALLVSTAQEFKDVPDRERIYRDGAYTLAIAGDWESAKAAALSYKKENLNRYAGDMIYLLARSQEYQMRFHDAAKTYLATAKDYPSHGRADTSLTRAEILALAENDYELAASTMVLVAKRATQPDKKIEAYTKAFAYYEKAAKPESAVAVANNRLDTSKTAPDQMVSKLMLAKAQFQNGNETDALNEYEKISKQAEREKERLSNTTYASVAGEVNFLLGEEARQQFDDFLITERGGSVSGNINHKLKYFEELVTLYDRSAKSEHHLWATRARYRLAEAAEMFADEISAAPVKTEQILTLKDQKRHTDLANRLKGLAKRYYSTNVLLRNKNPSIYRDNLWVKKSVVKLTGYGDINPKAEYDDQLPMELSFNMPNQWSL